MSRTVHNVVCWSLVAEIACLVPYGLWVAIVANANSNTRSNERCKKLRREFFASCIAAEPRYRCEVQWAQLGDKVFDYSPEQSFSGQVDCAGKFED